MLCRVLKRNPDIVPRQKPKSKLRVAKSSAYFSQGKAWRRQRYAVCFASSFATKDNSESNIMAPQTPTRCVDGTMDATTPAERLSTALKMARATMIVYSDDTGGNDKNIANDELLQVGEINQNVASTRNLTLEMESAGLEMQRALREAQDFLALEDRQDTNTEEQRQDTECEERDATITSNVENTINTFDVQSLLDEIAALKKSVQEANDEVTELKSALNTSLNNTASKADMDAKSPVDEVLCSKSTCDTTFITCSIRNCEEDQYGHEDNGTSSGADWEGEDRMEICGNICFLGKFANLILANTAHKKEMLMIP